MRRKFSTISVYRIELAAGVVTIVQIHMKKAKNIDEFIEQYPEDIQAKMQRLRLAILKIVPDAEQTLNYGIACFKWHGNLIFFSGYKNHIGVYPRPKGFETELAPYKGGKGTIQFPHEKPIPLTLITKVVKARMKENLARETSRGLAVSKAKTKKKK